MTDPHEPHEPHDRDVPPGPDEPGAPDVGSVGEEAAKLFGALSDWARESDAGPGLGSGLSGLAGHAAGALRDLDQHVATGAPECTYCPVCRTVHVVRAASPEVRAHLASAASSFLQAVAGVLATVPPPGSGGPGRPGGTGGTGGAHGSELQHIDLDLDGDDDD